MRVIIAGGGISGLSLALSLHQIGIDCRVYESVLRLEPQGLGINIQPNAVRELTALGLGDALAERGVLTQELAFYNKHGQLVWSEPRGLKAGYRWPQISISRGDLQDVLLTAVRQRLGADAVVAGHHLSDFEQRGDRVIARFVDPASRSQVAEVEADLLIGADGIRSAVRRHFYPTDNPIFDGYVHYRGYVEGDPYLTGASVVIIGHRTHRLIIYPIARRPGGKLLINWLAYAKAPDAAPPLEDWGKDADRDMVAALYAGWSYPWIDAHGILARTERAYQFPNVDRDPIPRWSFGRVTMVGDAAHPMQPIGGQAGSQAIVDGRVLAACLASTPEPVEALIRYQDQRIAAMNAVVVRNRNFGPETVLQVAEERAPDGFQAITDVLSRDELEQTALNFKKAAGIDIETVNSRDSIVEVGGAA